MTDPNPETVLSDPLSAISRRERRNLLIASSVAVLMGHAGLVPKRLSAFDIEFDPPAQSTFLFLMAAIVAYFILAFFTYALADFLIWRKRRHDYIVSMKFAQDSEPSYEDEMERHRLNIPSEAWYFQWGPRVAYARAFLEFALPLLIGLYAFVLLLVSA